MKAAVCAECGTGNRIASGRDASTAKCGKCGAKLFAGKPLDVNDVQFQQHLKLTEGAILLDVWAPWCGPCRMMAPHFAEAAKRLEPNVRLLKLNADESAAAGQLGIRGIPALILFRNGKEVARQAGAQTADALVAWTKEHLPALKPMEKSV
jgi:thioredoxin 2